MPQGLEPKRPQQPPAWQQFRCRPLGALAWHLAHCAESLLTRLALWQHHYPPVPHPPRKAVQEDLLAEMQVVHEEPWPNLE